MSRCLLCLEKLAVPETWASFFFPARRPLVCEQCGKKFERITGKICTSCGRPLAYLDETYKQGDMCLDCFRWHKEGDVLEKNRSVFIYNHWMKEVMARYKFRGDCAIVHAFAKEFRAAFRLYYGSNYEIVPIPLSEERLMERGFNQAQLLASLLPSSGPPCSLVRVHTEKQSQKTRQERLGGISPFSFSSPERFDGRRILLIDDIYTTGTTLRQAAALFRERGAAGVSSLTLCRS